MSYEERAGVEPANNKMDFMMKYSVWCCIRVCLCACWTWKCTTAQHRGVRGVLSFDGQRPLLLRLVPHPLIVLLSQAHCYSR